jgi:hypothetical protein
LLLVGGYVEMLLDLLELRTKTPEEESLFEDLDLDDFLKEKSGGKAGGKRSMALMRVTKRTMTKTATFTVGVLGGYSLFSGAVARIDVIKVGCSSQMCEDLAWLLLLILFLPITLVCVIGSNTYKFFD